MTAVVSLDRGRIRLGGLLVYLEHVRKPDGPLTPGVVPRAYGVAPTTLSAEGEVLAAVDATEAVWLGFQAVDRSHPVRVRVWVEHDEALDAVTGGPWDPDLAEDPRHHLAVPPASRLVGVPHSDGIHLFAAPMRLRILLVDPPRPEVGIRLLDPERYARLTGRTPPPLDPGRGYTDWRAP